jgi:hypothetical protein
VDGEYDSLGSRQLAWGVGRCLGHDDSGEHDSCQSGMIERRPNTRGKIESSRNRDEYGYCSYLYPDGIGKRSGIRLDQLAYVRLARRLRLTVLATERRCKTQTY